MKLNQFPAQETSQALDAWLEDIANASHGEFSVAHIRESLERGTHAGFYVLTNEDVYLGVLLITVMTVADGSGCLVVVGASGEVLGQWHEASDLLMELAVAVDCKGVSIRGRKGFVRAFKEFGWEEQYTVLHREVK
jgi:hypothetical protein